MSDDKAGIHCSFCGKHQDEVAIVIAGLTGFICSECVAMCVNVIADAASRKARTYFVRPEDVPQAAVQRIVEEARTLADANSNHSGETP